MKIIQGFYNSDDSNNYLAHLKKISPHPIIQSKQVHGAKIKIFNDSKSILNHNEKEEYDGGLLFTPATYIIRTADCIPIQFIDTHNSSRIWGAQLHCGWRSVQKGIIENLLKIVSLSISFKIVDKIQVRLGPGICHQCYEVGPDLIDQFKFILNHYSIHKNEVFTPKKTDYQSSKYFFNLKKLIILILTNNRISNNQINSSKNCTYCQARYYSYRSNQTLKRNISFVGLVK